MTKAPLHPSEYQNHWESSLRSQLAAYGTLAIAVAVAIASTQINEHRLRTGLVLASLFGVSVSRIAVSNQVEKARILQDIVDVSDAQRQQRMYEAMKPGAQTALHTTDDPLTFLRKALDFPVVSIHGAQGTGKTTLAQWLSTTLDSRQIVLDPHHLRGDWPNCEVVGSGANYDAIDYALVEAMTINKQRYQQRARGVSEFEPITYIVEELTSWEGSVPNASKFIRMSLSDFRKANQRLIKISHGRTNTAQGGAAGTAKMRAEGEVEIHLIRRGLAHVTFPFQDPVELELPQLNTGTFRRAEPFAETPEPTDSQQIEMMPAELPKSGSAVISAILAEWNRNGGRLRSDFLKEDLGMQGRNYAGAKKFIEMLFSEEEK